MKVRGSRRTVIRDVSVLELAKQHWSSPNAHHRLQVFKWVLGIQMQVLVLSVHEPISQPQNIAFNEQRVYANMTQRLRLQTRKTQYKDVFNPVLVSIRHLQALAKTTFEYIQPTPLIKEK